MNKKVIFPGILSLCLAICQPAPAARQQIPQHIDSLLSVNKVPAAAIALLENGKLTYTGVYGELKKGVKAPPDAIFNVASLTKPVTAMVTLALVNKGMWDLDEPLFHYWTDPDIKNDPRHKKLTTRIVLSHQTGFPNWRWNNGGTKLVFQFEPGTKYQYSGEGIEYVRKAIEKKFHRSLEELARQYVFTPLKMPDTRFTWDVTFENKFAAWHNRNGDNTYETRKRSDICAADDLMCTIADYGRFAEFVLQGGGLSKPLFDDMVSAQVNVSDHMMYGLGWLIVKDLPGGEYAVVHTGADVGVRTAVILLPKSNRGIVVFTNGDNGNKVISNIVTEMLDCGKTIIEYMSR